jgi:hypothetical protein
MYQPPPASLPAFPHATRATPKTSLGGGKLRKRWKDPDGTIYEWDYQHGTVERYSPAGQHEGEFDPQTGEQTKNADSSRSVEP